MNLNALERMYYAYICFNAAKLAKSILSSDEQETYTSLLNQERAKAIAKSQSFGIAEALVNQFSSKNNKVNKLSNKSTLE